MNLLHNIIEPTFNDTATQNYLLSLLVGGDSVSYFINDEQGRVLALRTYTRATSTDKTLLQFVKRVLSQDALLRQPFQSVRLGWHSAKFTLIPQVLWEESQAENYLKATLRLHAGEQCYYHSLAAEPALQTVYAAEKAPMELLLQHFPNAIVKHSLSGQLLYLLNHLPNKEGLVSAAHLHSDSWTITILQKNKLLYHNTFRYKNSADCLYYTLSVFKYLNLNPQNNELYLSGELMPDSEIYNLLYKYIKHLHFLDKPSFYQYGEHFKAQIPSHFYLELLSLSLSY